MLSVMSVVLSVMSVVLTKRQIVVTARRVVRVAKAVRMMIQMVTQRMMSRMLGLMSWRRRKKKMKQQIRLQKPFPTLRTLRVYCRILLKILSKKGLIGLRRIYQPRRVTTVGRFTTSRTSVGSVVSAVLIIQISGKVDMPAVHISVSIVARSARISATTNAFSVTPVCACHARA